MAEKPKTNVDKFFEIYDADPALQARVQQAMDSYPGSLEIRDVMTEHVLLPVAEAIGVDPIHFGIIMTLALAIAFVTPPVALNLFVGSSMTGLSIDKIVKAFMPFLIGLIVAFFIVSFVPAISLGVLGDWSLTFG